MKEKIALIVCCISAGVVALTLIVLSVITTSVGLDLPKPASASIYNHSQAALETYSAGDEEYDKIIELYNDMCQKSLLEALLQNQILDGNVSELDTEEAFVSADRENGLFLELNFSSTPYTIVKSKGSTRKIYVSSIIFELTSDNKMRQVKIFYKSGNNYQTVDEYGSTIYPFALSANTYKLYEYIKTLL